MKPTSGRSKALRAIRSRCQSIRFAPILREAIETFLVEEKKFPTADAALLSRTAGGSLGRALGTDIDTYRERRDSMLEVLTTLVLTDDRAQLLRAAEGLAAPKERDEYERRLDALEGLIRDAWALRLGRPDETIVNGDLLRQLKPVAAEMTSEQAGSWLTLIEELRGALDVNINRKIASDALLLTMAT